jgi:hypothetical protein
MRLPPSIWAGTVAVCRLPVVLPPHRTCRVLGSRLVVAIGDEGRERPSAKCSRFGRVRGDGWRDGGRPRFFPVQPPGRVECLLGSKEFRRQNDIRNAT